LWEVTWKMDKDLINVLLVEDNPLDIHLVRAMLAEASLNGSQLAFDVTSVEDLGQALDILTEKKFGVILLDLLLPDSRGLDTLSRVLDAAPEAPIIVLSGLSDQDLALEAVKAGAQDFLVKGRLDEYSLPRAIRYAIERKRAAEALRESEARYRAVSELTSDYTDSLRVEPDGTLIREWATGAFTRITGYDPDDLPVQDDWKHIVHPDDRPIFLRRLETLLSGQADVSEYRIITKHGEVRWLRSYGRPTWDEAEDRVVGYIGAAQDITDRMRVEKEMRARNRELALLNRIITASVNYPDVVSVLELACRELASAFDVPQATIALLNRDKTVAQVVAEYRADDHPPALNEAIPVAGNPSFQHLLTHKTPLAVSDAQDNPRLASIHNLIRQRGTVSFLRVPLVIQGEVVGSLGLDATEPRRFSAQEISLAWSVADQVSGALARARLAESQRRLSTAIEQAAESVIITDAQGAILYVNPAFERITGYSRGEAIGQNLDFLKSETQDATSYEELWATVRAGKVWQGRFVSRRRDGTLFTEEATISPVRNQDRVVTNYVALKRDVTRELYLEEQYRQAQKMEAIGQLTAGIAHDFNNLLTAINGFATLVQSEFSSDDPAQELIDKVLASGRRAADLVRQLLAFSRRQIIAPQVLNLNDVVADMDKLLRRIIGEHIELRSVLAPDLVPVKADPAQLEQIIVNLAVNARDAMTDGGKLTIETANVALDEDYTASHVDVQPGDYVLLAISDTGFGISEAAKPHIFEPFFTTKERGKGTGLGLATVYGIVKQSGGNIWFYSEEGVGTTFKVYLPQATEAASEWRKPMTERQIPTGHETVLLVEDDDDVRDLARLVLKGQGYTVLEACDGQQAAQISALHGGPIHLLLTDVVMPGTNGNAVASQMSQAHPDMKTLFMSGYPDEAIAHHGVLEPEVAFLQKPFRPADLARKVRTVLDG
jgi:PAS domain S-box-containing protein